MARRGAEERYLNLLLEPLDLCANYKPKFGTSEDEGISLEQFRTMYGADPFYHWVGLDSDLMYAAHKAAGGMTSIYRQLGSGCERLLRAVIQDHLQISDDDVTWSYDYEKDDGTKATAYLDARIDVEHLTGLPGSRTKVVEWLRRCGEHLELPLQRMSQLRGAIFEVRQGYKSADAKRQNADLRFAMNATAQNYLPVVAVVSTQTSQAVIRRYKNAKILVVTGTLTGDAVSSTYTFFREVVGFELQEFFRRNSKVMRERCQRVLAALLTPS
jgi:hypothetical protein